MPVPIPFRYELQVGGTWTDITTDVYDRDPVSSRRGQEDGGARADPARCGLTLRNRDGKYSPRNPMSPYYGLIGRNTRFRELLEEAAPRLVLDGSASGAVSTPDAAALDITADLDLRAEVEIDWSAAALNQTLIGKWDGTSAQRSYALRVYDGQLQLSWSPDGVTGGLAAVPVPTLPDRAAVRATLDVDNGAGGRTITFYWAASLAGPWTQIGDPVIQTGSTSVYASTVPLRIGSPDPSTTPPRVPFTGSGYRFEVRSGIDGTLVASPDFTAQAADTTSFTDSAGCVWTVEGTAEITRWRARFDGEVSAWPARWDLSGNDVWVPIQASGILRRLGQGAKALDSTLRRRIPTEPALLGYWPMEEERDATQAYSPLDGVAPMTVSGVEFAADDSLAGSSALPKIGPTSSFTARVPSGPSGAWRVECVYRLDDFPTAAMILEVRTTGTYDRLQIEARPANIRLYGISTSGDSSSTTLILNIGPGAFFVGAWNRLQMRAETVGSSTTFHCNWITIGAQEKGLSTTVAGTTAGRVTAVSSAPGSGLDQRTLHMGHLSVMSVVQSTIYNFADEGFAGETAFARLRRLCHEEGVPLVISGAAGDTTPMGPQRPATLLELLQQAADADGGMLLEQRDQLALRYRIRASLYNQPPALTLDYTARGEIPAGLEPVDDDATTRNDITVQRQGGSAARAVLEEGPLSVQPPPDGVGVYDESVTLVLADDGQAEPIACWRLHLGTWDEARYPTVTVDLAAAPHLAAAAAAVQEGDRITIRNLPAWLPSPIADLQVTSVAETKTLVRWTLTYTCVPAGPWTVAETPYIEDFEDTTYALTITGGGTLPWTRTTDQAHTGTWSLRSGAISNNQTSDAIVALPTAAETLTFWYRVSSEGNAPGFEGDRLLVLVDGVQQLRAQGTTSVAWTRASLDVTGKSTVTFRYAKDNSAAAGEDAAYIDDLAVTLATTPLARVDTDGSELAAAIDADDITLTVAITAGPAWTTSPDEFPLDIQVGGEVMTVTSIASPVYDAFQRLVTGWWGTANTGQAWTTSGGSASDFSVKGG
ncbi:hypothetical protein QFW82_23690 [Streptomyces malaysiensis subsp. malaysiensis]|uniref:hypothetical protein n=1 Tax=Streptomyces malaysiensis TaxID=92644 RepID=UPI0024BF60BB|nr:hypothetical protein [Streptomyces sp. NA07423]WHX19835.1 hypothetical protein QFW82_23690 [Streptomyces sp. NA07423]